MKPLSPLLTIVRTARSGIMPLNAYGGFKRMTGFCKTRIPPAMAEKVSASRPGRLVPLALLLHEPRSPAPVAEKPRTYSQPCFHLHAQSSAHLALLFLAF